MKKDITSNFPDLKPCPFCGSPAEVTTYGTNAVVTINCTKCIANIETRNTRFLGDNKTLRRHCIPPYSLVEMWNTRVVNDSN